MSLHASQGGNLIKSWTVLAEGKPQDLMKPLNFSEYKIERQIDLIMCPDFMISAVKNV